MKPSKSDKIKICPRCGKSDCIAPPLINPEFVDRGCSGTYFDLTAFEDDCANQREFRGRPAKKFRRSQIDDDHTYGIY